jgi:hypothetical protein
MHADGLADDEQLSVVHEAIRDEEPWQENPAVIAAWYTSRSGIRSWATAVAFYTRDARHRDWVEEGRPKRPEPTDGADADRDTFEPLRDIFGHLFRPVTADPSWLTHTVVSLASGIYAERAFDRLPILADALQDAGCDNADVLTHCRCDGPHVRGCWVVDLVLGKE